MVCYGFTPEEPEDPAFNFETEDVWYVRNDDPEDPIFYSTCYKQIQPRKFSDENPACPDCSPTSDDETDSESDSDVKLWRIGTKCRSCDDIKEKLPTDIVKIPNVLDECKKCY